MKTFRVWHARTLDDGLRVGPEGGEELVENGGVHGADRRTVEGLEAGEDGAVHGGRAGARGGGGGSLRWHWVQTADREETLHIGPTESGFEKPPDGGNSETPK